MNKNKISIIVPVYNIAKYLHNCLNSILVQTHKNIEVILVNDGSIDDSGKICDDYAKQDNRLVVIHKKNGGVSSARNAGLDMASGDYIGFVDGDDTIDDDMFELLLKNALGYQADISGCGYVMHQGEKQLLRYGTNQTLVYKQQEGLKEFIHGRIIEPALWNKLYKKELFNEQRLNEEIHINEDFLLNYYLYKTAVCSVFEDVCKYHYIKRESSASRSGLSDKQFELLQVSKIIISDNKNDPTILPYCIHKHVRSCFSLLNQIINTKTYIHQYEPLRKEILRYKIEIFYSGLFNFQYKISTVVLMFSQRIYNLLIISKSLI